MFSKKGFTLIELLIVIAIISIISGVVFVALDPLTRFRDSRDARRWADANAILSAVKIDQIDNGGSYLPSVANMRVGEVYMVSDGANNSSCTVANGYCGTDVSNESAPGDHCVDLSSLVTQGYLGSIPVSPNGAYHWLPGLTGYTLEKSANGILTVRSCEAENTSEIKSSR